MAKQNALVVKCKNVRHDQKTDYICITDLARLKDEEPAGLVANWLRSADTVDFIYEWENIYNLDFNHVITHQHLQKNAAAYIHGCLGLLKNDKRFLFQDSSQAQKAVNFLLEAPT